MGNNRLIFNDFMEKLGFFWAPIGGCGSCDASHICGDVRHISKGCSCGDVCVINHGTLEGRYIRKKEFDETMY